MVNGIVVQMDSYLLKLFGYVVNCLYGQNCVGQNRGPYIRYAVYNNFPQMWFTNNGANVRNNF